MHEVIERLESLAESFEEQAEEADRLGQLPGTTVKQLRKAGAIRLLQPREFGGYEAHPADFFKAVFEVGSHSASAGWVCGVVGIHPWQLSQIDHRAQTEIWGEDPDTWVASPYAPMGRARKADGGYRLTGRWSFSSGTDACDWVILGGMLADDDGEALVPPQMRHFILPRADYEIIADSWEVMGLKGSGSKDIQVTGAFVPDYRVLDPEPFQDGSMARASGRDGNPLYLLPFSTMFPGAIVASTLGIAEGALAAFVRYTRDRVSVRGDKMANDPFQLAALSTAAADIRASQLHVVDDVSRLYDQVAAGGTLTMEQRVEVRRNQVRATARAVDAVDALFNHAGGTSIRLSNPLQRFWRDLHAARNHLCNVAEPLYLAAGQCAFGLPVPPGTMA